MTDDLLSHYNQELAFIRQLGSEFALLHPKVASRLKLGEKTVEDPHVSRLIESVALLNARIKQKLDDDFPELINGLFSVMYPHYLAPIPSMSLVQFNYKEQTLQNGYTVPRHVMLKTREIQQENCRFRTIYPVTLWPINLDEAILSGQPVHVFKGLHKFSSKEQSLAGVLRLSFSCTAKDLSFAELMPDHLRLFLNAPPQIAAHLYEMLFNNTVAIALATSPNDTEPVFLPLSILKEVGFALDDEELLPYPGRSFVGYRLLTEFFAFPEKFLFFDVDIADKKVWQKFSEQKVELYFYFKRIDERLQKHVSPANFVLGCTPIVNIFEENAEPIDVNHTQYEYQIIQNARVNPNAREVYAISQVTGINKTGEMVDYQPFYGMKHYKTAQKHYWYSSRKPASQGQHYGLDGTEVFLSFVDEDFDFMASDGWVVNAKVLSTNRNLPSLLPFGGNEPQLSLLEYPQDFIENIRCLVPMTSSYYPGSKASLRWKLISHLSLNHLSLDGEKGVDALKEILTLYNFSDSDEVKKMIEGFVALRTERVTIRNPLKFGNGFWSGNEIILEVNEDCFTSSGLFLFGTILERFFALYASLNSFTQLIIISKHKGELYRWQARAGEKTLL